MFKKLMIAGLILATTSSLAAEVKNTKPQTKPKGQELSLILDYQPKGFVGEMKAGEKASIYITAINTTDMPLSGTLQVKPMIVHPDNSYDMGAISRGEPGLNSLVSDIIIPEPEISLAPHEQRKVPLIVNIPPTAQGSMYALYTIVLSEKSKRQMKRTHGKSGISFSLTLLAPLTITIKNTKHPEVVADGNITYNPTLKQIRAEVSMKNTGNIELVGIKSSALIIQNKQEPINKFDLQMQGSGLENVIQTTKRNFIGIVNQPLAPGKYLVLITISDHDSEMVKTIQKELIVN